MAGNLPASSDPNNTQQYAGHQRRLKHEAEMAAAAKTRRSAKARKKREHLADLVEFRQLKRE